MSSLNMLSKAITLAAFAHNGQVDKQGRPYILHPLRVMLGFHDEDDMIVAVLHDVVEDSDLTLFDLRDEKFSDKVVEAVAVLTRRVSEDYFEYIFRVSQNDIARRVKIADLRDNMGRMIGPEMIGLAERYAKALNILEGP